MTVTARIGFGARRIDARGRALQAGAAHGRKIRHGSRGGVGAAAFTVRREPRVLSAKQRRVGPRTSYVGGEVFVALVDGDEAPYRHELRQLGLTTLCTNRDLPLTMPVAIKALNIIRPKLILCRLARRSTHW